ncbi:MAG: DUF3450 domain-containing protein [bacterium]|nr:DUF3450 domain-containing protein [bacterium]
MNRMSPSRWHAALVAAVVLSLGLLSLIPLQATAQEGDPLDEAVSVRRQGNEEGVASQKRIDDVSAETESLFTRYQNALASIDSIRVYNAQMERLIEFQEEEISSLKEQVDRVELVSRSVTPLMLRMIEAIDATVRLDIPFLEDERRERIENLHVLMGRADVSNAEKYRQIMEAYQTENEYGRTIEAYRSTLVLGGTEVKVDLLRFGRIALVYQTLDGREAGVWNQETRAWDGLDSGYRTAIREGLKIARKQTAPDLIRLPLPVPSRGGQG